MQIATPDRWRGSRCQMVRADPLAIALMAAGFGRGAHRHARDDEARGRRVRFGRPLDERGERQGRTLPQAMRAFTSLCAKVLCAKVLCIKVLCIKAKPGRWSSRAQNHDSANGYPALRLLKPCPDCNTSALFRPTATFPPTECLTAPASYLSACGVYGWHGPHATPGPLRDASLRGRGVASSPRSRYLIPSERGRGQRGSASRHIQERNRVRPQQIDKANTRQPSHGCALAERWQLSGDASLLGEAAE
jgi:hypothetical protein